MRFSLLPANTKKLVQQLAKSTQPQRFNQPTKPQRVVGIPLKQAQA